MANNDQVNRPECLVKEKMFGFGAYHTPKTVHLEWCRLYQHNSTRGTKQELIVHLHINKVVTSWQVWCVYITGDKLKKLNVLWRLSTYSVDYTKWHSVCTSDSKNYSWKARKRYACIIQFSKVFLTSRLFKYHFCCCSLWVFLK